MAIPLDLHVNKAVHEANRLRDEGLIALILDEWCESPRLIYQFSTTDSCDSDCEDCPFLKLVGQDRPGTVNFRRHNLITNLVKAETEDISLFPGHQRFINCKSWTQYLGYHTARLIRKCQTSADFENALRLVRSFRLIFQQGKLLPQRIETGGRAYIIRTSQKIIEPPARLRLFETAAERIGMGRFLEW